jgi:hypothetical protein
MQNLSKQLWSTNKPIRLKKSAIMLQEQTQFKACKAKPAVLE